jgi:ADP-ribose pyrophosphatase YjhB (NUDIX family)
MSDPAGSETYDRYMLRAGVRPIAHEVLAVVLQIRDGRLQVLAWRRAQAPDRDRWALPGGLLGDDEDVETSVRRQLAEKVDVREVAHVEQLAVFSDPNRVPGIRRVATAFLGLVPSDADPAVPDDTAWHPVGTPPAPALPAPAFDHAVIVDAARDRLRAKLSYTNLGFALAPGEFTISTLREHYAVALGHPVSATNLQRVLTRRALLVPTGALAPPGPAGGRPAALFRFAEPALRITDAFAVLRPPGEPARAAVP